MRKNKKPDRPEFEGKSGEYQEGYESAEEYFDHIYKGGNRLGSAPFRVFVEAVALSMRNGEKIGEGRMQVLGYILKWSDSEFNRGVHDLLVTRAKEYNANALIEQVIGDGKNEMPEV